MKKPYRDIIKNKYGGLCAYTGKPLGDDWQIDHIFPKCSYIWHQSEVTKNKLGVSFELNDIGNLVPTITIINHYKRALDLQGFRKHMKDFHKRLAKLPKKTSVPQTERRIQYMYKVAELFDITPDKPFTGKFYFETIQE